MESNPGVKPEFRVRCRVRDQGRDSPYSCVRIFCGSVLLLLAVGAVMVAARPAFSAGLSGSFVLAIVPGGLVAMFVLTGLEGFAERRYVVEFYGDHLRIRGYQTSLPRLPGSIGFVDILDLSVEANEIGLGLGAGRHLSIVPSRLHAEDVYDFLSEHVAGAGAEAAD